ncbi:PKS-ER domain-containing protein [Mycena chlorophos]|uniref:PKS-ER domain-containing protein n=1 Tax=Mycena chlorophos TaxID=658473 RepID=A0A8H6SXT2_MYCCL|nr:PKS-ER domain-containing protein [Mycena chlorophos]
MSAKHTAVAILSKGVVESIEVGTPAPGPGDVLLKVEYASMIAFDTYMVDLGYAVKEGGYPITLGNNASGTVESVGEGVSGVKIGDRIAAFSPHIFERERLQGTMQEYVVLPEHFCAKIPDDLALDAAATIPDNFVTAFYTLFDHLGLPISSSLPATSAPPNASVSILVYGAGTTTGQYVIQLLHAAGYMNVVVTASPRHHELLRSLGATHTLDYASETLAADLAIAAGGDGKFALAVDCISADATIAKIAPLVRAGGKVAILLPIKVGDTVAVGDAGMRSTIPEEENHFAEGVAIKYVKTFTYHQNNEFLKNELMSKILPPLLAKGIITPNRVRLLDRGATLKERVEEGLDLLRNNKVSGEKIIVKVH